MKTVPISWLVGILVAFVLLGIAFLVGGPTMLQGSTLQAQLSSDA